MTMQLSIFAAGVLASAFTVAGVVRLVRLARGMGSRPLFLAHLTMALCLWLAVPSVYRLVDGLLGGQNYANLLSHLGFILSFYWGASEAAHAVGRGDIARRITRIPGAVLAGGFVAAIVATFLYADVPSSSMGLDEYLGQPAVVLYKALSFGYPAWAGSQLVVPYFQASRRATQRMQRWSFSLVATGFALLPLVPAIQLLALARVGLQKIADLVLFPSIILVLIGVSLALFARSPKRRQRPSEQAH